MQVETQQMVKNGGVAAVGGVAYLADILPLIATGLTALWFALQILEKVTGKTVPQMLRCLLTRIRGR